MMTPLRHPADGRIHFSELKLHDKCPARVAHAMRRARDMTRPMTVGSVADAIVFGNRGWALYPGKVRAGKEWDSWRTEHAGQVTCIQSELDDARGAAEAVLADPFAKSILEGCEFQRVMHWDAYGLQCAAGVAGERGGFDAIHVPRGYIADLKVTSDTEPRNLQRHAIRMWWHAQAAWYIDGADALGLSPRDFYLICVEAQAPHIVTTLKLSRELIEWGRRSLRLWTEQHIRCEDSGEWPGYALGAVEFELPEWVDPGEE